MDDLVKQDKIQRAIKMRTQGMSWTKIAEELNVCRVTLFNWFNKEETKQLLEQETKQVLANLPDVVDQISQEVALTGKVLDWLEKPLETENKTLLVDTKDALDFLKHSNKTRENLLKIAGMIPTNTPSILVQNIYQDNRNQILSTEIFKALGGLFAGNDDIEEADVIE